MHTRYFRLKVPKYMSEEIEWIEMTGREFYRFANSPEGQGRHFIDMDDVVLEASETEARSFRTEQNQLLHTDPGGRLEHLVSLRY